MKLRKTIGFLAIVATIGFGFSKGVSPVASQDDMLLIDIVNDWSPDGNQILFSSNRGGNFDIWAVNSDGSNLTNLTSEYASGDGYAFWSPDGKSIAFKSDREGKKSEDGLGNFDLWVMASDGSNPRNLTEDIENSIDSFAWSPDGDSLALMVIKINFDSFEIYSEIWVINLQTDEKSRISPISEGNTAYENYTFTYPDWTPDGLVAYIASELGQVGEIWISGVSTYSREQLYIRQPLADMDVSPDGSVIICTAFSDVDREGFGSDLILVNIQNGDITNLTPAMSGFNADPEWSPDSSRIVFRSSDGDYTDVWIVSADGSGLTNLTADMGSFDGSPIWSSNGEQIAFVSNRFGESNIWVMNADGSNPINLTGDATEAQ